MTALEIVVTGLTEVLFASGEAVTIVFLAAWILLVWLPVMAAACTLRGQRNALGQTSRAPCRENAPDPADVGLATEPCEVRWLEGGSVR